MLIFASNSVVNLTDRAGSRIKTKRYENNNCKLNRILQGN